MKAFLCFVLQLFVGCIFAIRIDCSDMASILKFNLSDLGSVSLRTDSISTYTSGSDLSVSADGEIIFEKNCEFVQSVDVAISLTLPQTTGTTLLVNSLQPSSSVDSGAVVIEGGIGVEGQANVENLNVLSPTGTSLYIVSTEESTSIGSGALVLDGGASVSARLNVGGSIRTFATSGTSLQIDSTTDSTSVSTGAITTAGGIGVAKGLFVGGDVLLSSTSTVDIDSGAVQLTADGVQLPGGVPAILNWYEEQTISNFAWTAGPWSSLPVTTNVRLTRIGNVLTFVSEGYTATCNAGSVNIISQTLPTDFRSAVSAQGIVRITDNNSPVDSPGWALVMADWTIRITNRMGPPVAWTGAANCGFDAFEFKWIFVAPPLNGFSLLELGY